MGIAVMRYRPEAEPAGILYALLSAIAGTAGIFFYYMAVSRYKLSVVIAITALYPLVAILLSFLLLKEGINLKQGLGIIFALLAVILFSI